MGAPSFTIVPIMTRKHVEMYVLIDGKSKHSLTITGRFLHDLRVDDAKVVVQVGYRLAQ